MDVLCITMLALFFCIFLRNKGKAREGSKAGKVAIREHDVRRQAGLGSRQQGISLLEWKTAYNC